MRYAIIFALAATTANTAATAAEDYDMDCKIILCLAGGFPEGCGDAYQAMMTRIMAFPPKPPFGFCPMGSLADITDASPTDEQQAAMIQAMDDPALTAMMRSIKVEASYGAPTYCTLHDESAPCTPTVAMNGDGSGFRKFTKPGSYRGARVTYTDALGAEHATGNYETLTQVGANCRRDREGDQICDPVYGWVPLAEEGE